MRFTFSRILLIVFVLGFVGVGIVIACRAGTNLETMVPPAVAAPPPTPTELPAAEKEVAERAKQYLREHAAEYFLRPDLSDLKVVRVTISIGADDVNFQQLFQGIPIEGSGILVSVPHDRKQPFYVGSSYNPHIAIRGVTPPYPGPSGSAPTVAAKLSANDALSKGLTAIDVKGQLMKPATPELVLYPVGRVGSYTQYALAWRMMLHSLNPPGDWDIVIDAATGEVLRKYNMRISRQRTSPTSNAPTSTSPSPMNQSPTTSARTTQATPVSKASPTPSKQPLLSKPLQPSGTATAKVTPPKPRVNVPQQPNTLPAQPDHKILTGRVNPNQPSIRASATATHGWNTIMSEGFEGVWPPYLGAWWVSGTHPTWDDEGYKPRTGSKSAWCAGSSLNPASDNYANNMDAWTVFGSFNLSDATDAHLEFYYWLKSEANYDFFAWYASVDDYNYYGYRISGDSAGWQFVNFGNYSALHNFCHRGHREHRGKQKFLCAPSASMRSVACLSSYQFRSDQRADFG